jgi:hypothetical protein
MTDPTLPPYLKLVGGPHNIAQERAALIEEVTTDTPAQPRITTVQAETELKRLGIPFRTCNHGSMIAVGHVLFFPGSNTVCYQSKKKFKETGFEFFLDVLRKEGLYRG